MEINWSPDNKTLKQFGVISVFGFAGFAAVAFWGWGLPVVAGVLAGVGAAIWLLSMIHTPSVRYAYVGLSVLAYPIGFGITHGVLAAVYFLLCTPIGLIFKLIGRDALQRRFDPGATTYWHVPATTGDPSRYFRQF